jgi:NitT/TauT family transport system substrate-binding protein
MRTVSKLTVLAATALIGAGAAGAQTKATMHLDWLVNGYHAPFFVAVEKGMYKEAGLDITVRPGKGSVDSARAVASGDAQFGFPDAATAVKGISEGMTLTMVAVFLQETPMGVMAFGDKGIRKPKDLEGKTMGNVPIASTAKVLPAFFKKTGVDASKVKLVNHTFATAIPSVLAGQVDSGSGYIFGEYLAVKAEAKGREVVWIGFADHGIQMYSNGIAVNNGFLAANPKAVEGFVKASIRALDWTIKNPDEAIAITAKKTETAPAVLKEQLMVAIPLMNNADAKKDGLGSMSAAKWKVTQDIMVEYGEQKARVPDDKAWTSRFMK